KSKTQSGSFRLTSAWYDMICLYFAWQHENYDSHMPEVTGWSPLPPSPECSNARPSCDTRRIERRAHCLIAPTRRTRRDPDHRVTDLRRGVAESPSAVLRWCLAMVSVVTSGAP